MTTPKQLGPFVARARRPRTPGRVGARGRLAVGAGAGKQVVAETFGSGSATAFVARPPCPATPRMPKAVLGGHPPDRGERLLLAGAAAAAAGRRLPWMGRIGGALLLTGSAFTGWGIFEAGMASAEDPRYTVV